MKIRHHLIVIVAVLAASAAEAGRQEVRCVQELLTNAGYSPGPIDGAMGGKTRRAATEWLTERQGLELPELTSQSAGEWCASPELIADSDRFTAKQENLRFWTVPESFVTCSRSAELEPMKTNRTIYGLVWPIEKNLVARRFIEAVGVNIARAIASEEFDIRAFAEEYVRLTAGSDAFTVLDFEGPGGPSPVWATSLVLISASYAVSLFDQRVAWTAEERASVIAWGAKLDRNQWAKYKFASPDSVASIGAARILWGAATGQLDVFNAGLKEFRRVGRMLKEPGIFEENARDNNEDIVQMVHAAEAATQSGVNLYEMKFNGFTLHDAVEYHARNTLELGPVEITETDTGHTGSYFRTRNQGTHVGWIPIYLARFSDSHAAEAVKDLREAVLLYRYGNFGGASVAGESGCFWGD